VPSTRGLEVSRPQAELVEEAAKLVADGAKEITLLGQNVNSYGRDLRDSGATTFSGLLRELDQIEGLARLRYTSPHPKDIREDVVAAHCELNSLCEHIHLPLQAGSTRVLKAMRRTYSRERYLEKVDMIRAALPDIAITTDIIVGFPGETEADFLQTLEVVDEVGFDAAFTYIYSPRRDTEAAGLPDQLPHEVKVERLQRLIALTHDRAKEQGQRFLGRDLEVMVEGVSRTDESRIRGRTRQNKAVNFDGLASEGDLVEVRIEAATSLTLDGTQVFSSVPS
jgi:tRNA-2-methylthio-N6-dimethylallyladenosine synthase